MISRFHITRSVFVLFFLFGLFGAGLASAAEVRLHFSVDMRAVLAQVGDPATIGVRGSRAPLSWEQTRPLSDPDGDGVFTGEVVFDEAAPADVLEYKYVYGEGIYELAGEDNRIGRLRPGFALPAGVWDRPTPFDPAPWRDLLTVPAAALRADLAIVKEAFLSLHPGLYRYNDEASLARRFAELEDYFRQDRSIPEAYLAFSRFLAAIRCGHTFANFWNQQALVRQLLFGQPDKLPFAFRLVDRRMLVTKNASDNPDAGPGTEITAINGVPVATIVDSLFRYASADGGNDGKRLYRMQLTGYEAYEGFDAFFPLLFPPRDGQWQIDARDLSSGRAFSFATPALTRHARRARWEQRHGPLPRTTDEFWEFRRLDDRTAYLRLGTFVTWTMEMDWKKFLADAFRRLRDEAIPNLVIDIRGNEGGADEVNFELAKYIVDKPVTLPAERSRLRYERVPAAVAPYLNTWDNTFKDLSGRVEPAGDGFFRLRGDRDEALAIKPGKRPYAGRIFLLVDAGNSSATFLLARMAKENGLATLAGQETGGNRRGINGGMMFFLRLPNSRIEMDIPLYGNFPLTDEPDRGIEPDVNVQPRPEDIARGVDTELEAVRRLIAGGQTW